MAQRVRWRSGGKWEENQLRTGGGCPRRAEEWEQGGVRGFPMSLVESHTSFSAHVNLIKYIQNLQVGRAWYIFWVMRIVWVAASRRGTAAGSRYCLVHHDSWTSRASDISPFRRLYLAFKVSCLCGGVLVSQRLRNCFQK